MNEGDLAIYSPLLLLRFTILAVIPASEDAFVKDVEAYAKQQVSDRLNPLQFRNYWLKKYLDSAAAVFYDETISRREIVKYVANHLGGTHFGKSERLASQKLQDLLDPAYVQFNEMPSVYMELLNIGRVVVDSTDAMRLEDELARHPVPGSPFDSASM